MPSAPPEQLYPELPSDNFRLTRICEIQTEISLEIENYRNVAVKCKKTQTAKHYVAVGLGSHSAALSATGIVLSLTGPGIIVGVPVGAVGAFCGAGSVGLTSFSRKLTGNF